MRVAWSMKRRDIWPDGAGMLWSFSVSCWRLAAEFPIRTVYCVAVTKELLVDESTCLEPATVAVVV